MSNVSKHIRCIEKILGVLLISSNLLEPGLVEQVLGILKCLKMFLEK